MSGTFERRVKPVARVRISVGSRRVDLDRIAAAENLNGSGRREEGGFSRDGLSRAVAVHCPVTNRPTDGPSDRAVLLPVH